MEKFFWADWWSRAMSCLLMGQDVEELAGELKKAPNTISCWTYKSKLGMPNAEQLTETLEFVNRRNPAAVSQFLRDFCAQFGVVAGSRGEVLRQVAQEIEVRGQGLGTRDQEAGVLKQFRFPRGESG